jgi:hypothetical protein
MRLVRIRDTERVVDVQRASRSPDSSLGIALTGSRTRFGFAELTSHPKKMRICRFVLPAGEQAGLDQLRADGIVVWHRKLAPAAAVTTHLAAIVDQHGRESGRNS